MTAAKRVRLKKGATLQEHIVARCVATMRTSAVQSPEWVYARHILDASNALTNPSPLPGDLGAWYREPK